MLPKIPKVLIAVESSRGSGRSLLEGIARYAQTRGPWSIYWEPGGLEDVWPKLKAQDLDGIILRDGDQLEEVLVFDLPAVVIGHGRGEMACLSNVITDSDGIGKMAAEHLLACGYKNFAYCGYLTSIGNDAPWSELRRQSFSDHIRQAGYPCESFELPRSFLRPARRRERGFMARWLQSLPKPLGLMAANDDRARQVAEACKVAGISMPLEVGIVGVDNDDLVCELCDPPLSSIAANFDHAGYEAASALDCLMKGGRPDPTRIMVYPTQIVIRSSTNFKSFSPAVINGSLIDEKNREVCEILDSAV